MTYQKRLFDLCLALVLLCLLALPIGVLICVLILKREGPVFYISERMKTPTQGFALIKFRTMRGAAENSGVSGADKEDRITPIGRMLRGSRLDEVPQLWNVLRGDISFVGPRPPLREYVERFPEVYNDVLQSRPGITGLATIKFHAHEAWWLQQSDSAQKTDELYVSNCIPRKARLDSLYQDHQSVCFDIKILLETAAPLILRRPDKT
jgi:lipopolysaccharide/colanic/teichoic acid biosynthesis glycosyltransferase